MYSMIFVIRSIISELKSLRDNRNSDDILTMRGNWEKKEKKQRISQDISDH